MKTAFIFPGQGAQFVGMAKDFYDEIPECRDVIDTAAKCLDFDLKQVMFEPNELINKTEYTQACLLTAEVCMLEAVKKIVTPDIAAGLSLGEYAALVAAGVMTLGDAVKVVRERGRFMEFAVPGGMGGMAAVIGLDGDTVSKICKEVTAETGKTVVTANYNCPGQIVISGYREAVEAAAEKLKAAGAKLVSILNVSGPFHSPLLEEAGARLAGVLDNVGLSAPVIPYVANVTARTVFTDEHVKALLVSQVSSPVKWEQSIAEMKDAGVELFVEIGPGKTLAGFMKRIDPNINIITVNKVEDLEKLAAAVGGQYVGSKHTAA